MKQYIDKDAVVVEIRSRFDEYSSSILKHYDACKEAKAQELGKLLTILDTLEVKEEILDKEGKTKLMKKCVHKAYKRGYDMGVLQTTNKMNHNAKEVDLEKEIDKFYGMYRKDSQTFLLEDNEECVDWKTDCNPEFEMCFAKHFFELGLKAKGE